MFVEIGIDERYMALDILNKLICLYKIARYKQAYYSNFIYYIAYVFNSIEII